MRGGKRSPRWARAHATPIHGTPVACRYPPRPVHAARPCARCRHAPVWRGVGWGGEDGAAARRWTARRQSPPTSVPCRHRPDPWNARGLPPPAAAPASCPAPPAAACQRPWRHSKSRPTTACSGRRWRGPGLGAIHVPAACRRPPRSRRLPAAPLMPTVGLHFTQAA